MVHVGVIGSANWDVTVRVPVLPQPGETVVGLGLERSPGGKGANQARAVVSEGAQAALYGAVGGDADGAMLLEHLKGQDVDTSAVVEMAGAATGVASIWVDAQGGNAIAVVPGANKRRLPDGPALERFIAAADVVVASLEVPLGTVELSCKLSREAGVPMILNLAPYRLFSPSAMKCVHTLVMNEVEASAYVDRPVVDVGTARAAAGAALQKSQAQAVAVTIGPAGCVLADSDDVVHVPTSAADPDGAISTVGAGDVFVGTYAVAIASGAPVLEAARRAVGAATAFVASPAGP